MAGRYSVHLAQKHLLEQDDTAVARSHAPVGPRRDGALRLDGHDVLVGEDVHAVTDVGVEADSTLGLGR